MSHNAPATWLVTYDIADPRRLARVFKYLKKQGVPIQYSVFVVEASATKMLTLITELARLIHPDADDIRAYRLPQDTWKITLGQSMLPTDILPGLDALL